MQRFTINILGQALAVHQRMNNTTVSIKVEYHANENPLTNSEGKKDMLDKD